MFAQLLALPPQHAPNEVSTAQYPTLFDRYPTRPPWPVAGVDYVVGITPGTVLTDWRAMTNPGVIIGTHGVQFRDTNNILIDGVDFSMHSGAPLSFVNCTNITIQNCFFGGPQYLRVPAGIIQCDPACNNITIVNNELDAGGVLAMHIATISNSNPAIVIMQEPHGLLTGNSIGFSQIDGANLQFYPTEETTGWLTLNSNGGNITVIDVVTFSIAIDTTTFPPYPDNTGIVEAGGSSAMFIQSGGPTSITYNWIKHMASRPLTMANGGTLFYRYNLFEQGAYAAYTHLNFLEWSGVTGTEATCDVSYNTIVQTLTVSAGGEGYQIYFNGQGTMNSPVVQFNTTVARTDNTLIPYIELSNIMHGSGTSGLVDSSGFVTFVTGTCLCTDNYYDASAAYGWYYTGSMPSPLWTVERNFDLLTTQDMIAEGSATITTLNIAPVVAGRSTVVSGLFNNGQPGGVFLIVDGDPVDNSYNFQMTSGYSVGGAGFFTATFATPTILGDHVVSVHTFGSNATVQFDVPFTVIATTDPHITVNTPAANMIEGTPLLITGTYVNGKPSSLTYNINGVGQQMIAGATISNGTFSFTIPAPWSITSINGGNGAPGPGTNNDGHIITITAEPSGAQTTSGSFPTVSAPTMQIVTPFSDTHATLDMIVPGTYGGPAPTSLNYSIDNGPILAAPLPIIGNANWTFTIPAPAVGNHTITVTGTGANTHSATSDVFRTDVQIFTPGPPGIPTAALTTPDLIAMTWAIPTTGSAVDSYRFESSPHGTSTWTVEAAGTSLTTFVAVGLTPSSNYDFRVNASNLAGTSAYATNTIGISTTSGFLDGLAGAPAGVAPQLPNILSGYPARPVWNVAGVDYGVGIPAATTLTDWTTLSGSGVIVGANSVEFNGVVNAVVDSVDFSLHGGAALLFFNGSNNATVSNCKFGGASVNSNAAINTDPLSAGLTVLNCEFDSGSAITNSLIWARGGGTITVQYCWSTYIASYMLIVGDLGGVVNLQWNLNEGALFFKGDSLSSSVLTPVVAFNTNYRNTGMGPNPSIELLNALGSMTNPFINNNVVIATGTASGGFGIKGGTSSSGFLFENWIDSSSAFGPFYTGSFTNWVEVENVDLVTGMVLPAP